MRRFEDIPDVTKNLLILNIIVFIVTNFKLQLISLLGLHYISHPDFYLFQFITSIFVHAPLHNPYSQSQFGLFHILFNMYALYSFGGLLENVWGAKRFGIFYLICGIGANIINTIVNIIIVYKATGQVFISEADISNSLLDQTYNGFGVGASGAIFGILGAYFVLFPHTKLSLMFPPITLEARIFIPIYVLIELYLATNRFEGDNIGHVAHLGGVFIGYILVKIWNKRSNTFY